MNNLPPSLDTRGLASLLYKSLRTIHRYLKEKPEALPPGRQVGNKWVWDTDVVLKWLSPPNPIQTPPSIGDQLIQVMKMQAKKGKTK